MDETLESVVAENRELRKEVKTLRARVTAVESSRWWHAHPRHLLRRLRERRSADGMADAPSLDESAKVKRAAESWRLKTAHTNRNVAARPGEIIVRDGIRLQIHPDARWSFEQFCYGAPEQVDELDAFLAATLDRHRLLDVGALHGIFSLVFAARDERNRVVAVDASPFAFARLLYNVRRNDATNVTPVECALSNTSGRLVMHYESEHAVAGADGPGVAKIPSETGDALCERLAFEPDVVKIDVEGHELRVLQGLEQTFERNRPLLFLEVHPHMMAADPQNGTLRELADELRRLGYATADVEHLDEITRVMLRPDEE